MDSTISSLSDPQGRLLRYLRLSITDVCNYRCQYCLPQGYQKPAAGRTPFLTVPEITHLVTALAGLGLWKVRLTGGEPTVRADLTEIAQAITAIPGIEHVALTTNGYRLAERAPDWRAAGISAVNISIDSLDRARFAQITGRDHLLRVLEGVAVAQAAGMTVKVNTVLLRGLNDDALPAFVDWAQAQAITLRFIELMETGHHPAYFQQHHLSSKVVVDYLQTHGWEPMPRPVGAGPAQEFMLSGAPGRVGVIAPYGTDFCAGCNRLRVTATGEVRLCLFGRAGHSVRELLQSPTQCADLQQTLRTLVAQRSAGHLLHQHETGATPHLAVMGG